MARPGCDMLIVGQEVASIIPRSEQMSPKLSSEPGGCYLNREVALFRYGLIAPLVHDPPPSGHQERRRRQIATKTYTIPASTRTRVSVTTLRRYLKLYREGGFDALRPRPAATRPNRAPSRPTWSNRPSPCASSNPPAPPRP